MTNRIAVFYHCLFHYGGKLLPNALYIVHDQMRQLQDSGLLDACEEMTVGINGGPESESVAKSVLPAKAKLVFHGLESRSENLTIVELEKWAARHPGWHILYFHSKGVTHPPGTEHYEFLTKWRNGMMEDLVISWQRCVSDLVLNDIACSLWLWGLCDGTQNIPAGNCLWVKSSFAAKLPSMYERARIKMSGISSVESRFEAEVYWGNGPRPKVKQYRPYWTPWIQQL